MLKLATWNVNSLKVRLDQVINWLETSGVDVLSLQETKITDEFFPKNEFEQRGYHCIFSGQKTYNGVAVISRHPIQDVLTDLPSLADPQRRILAVTVAGIRLINLYVPNGAAVDTDKYAYKLNWLDKVTEFIQREMLQHGHVAVMGDFNIAPADNDVHSPIEWEGSVLVSPPEREAFQRLIALGLSDSFRYLYPEQQSFTWWDYRAASFRRNRGMRIDHILLSDGLKSVCLESTIDPLPRSSERPSDHTPMFVTLQL